MKKLIVISISVLASILIIECAPKSNKTISNNQTPTVDKIQEINSKFNSNQIQDGKNLYENNCAKCHSLKTPEHFTINQWERIIPGMAHKANINVEQTALIRAYLLTHSKA